MIRADAPAKINLCLHVTGRREDGYHLIDTLVVFADLGEHLRLAPGPRALRIEGPEAAGLGGADNLVLRAADWGGLAADMQLHKTMPVSSGIGGGSSDAAAALRGLAALHGRSLPEGSEALGADLPMCLAASPVRATGIGEQLAPLPALPPLWLVLANPRQPIRTPDVFARLTRRDSPALPVLPKPPDARSFAEYLRGQRNDLEAPAMEICPEIKPLIAALAQGEALLARMSGSGATCFALHESAEKAADAAANLRRAFPDFWIRSAPVLGAAPQLIRATT